MYIDDYDVELVGHYDWDLNGNPCDKMSILAYVFNIGSGLVSWSSKKQPTIFWSST